MRLSAIYLAITRPGGAGAGAFNPAVLWPLGASSPGLWTDPSTTASLYQDSAGTTAISAIGTVLDTSNPVGLILDRKGGAAKVQKTFTGWAKTGGDGVVTISGNLITITGATTTTHVSPATRTMTLGVTGIRFTYTNVSSAVSPLVYVAGVPQAPTSGVSALNQTSSTNSTTDRVQIASGTASFLIEEYYEIPGIHLSQATGTSRPVASARSNWLLKTEDLTNAAWGKYNIAITAGHLSLSGQPDAFKIIPGVGYNSNGASIYQASSTVVGSSQVIRAKADGFDWAGFIDATGSALAASFDLANGVVGTVQPNYGASITSLGNGWYECEIISLVAAQTYYQLNCTNSDGVIASTGDGVKGVLFWHPQDGVPGATYQRVTTASDYDASAGPTYLKFDGVDDSLSSATFAAGTISGLTDCLMAVRRDSDANATLGLVGDINTRYFGYAGPWHIFIGCGSPTVLVNGLAVPALGGYTGLDLKAVLTPGTWHIIEFRGLDLSAWTSLKVDADPGLRLNGAIGGIQLFASGQDANRDLARAQMAAYFGVTLP